MARGFKTGGRTPGTPNRRSEEFDSLVKAALGRSVPEALLVIYKQDIQVDLKVRILMELMPYLYPKKRPIEEFNSTVSEQDRLTVHLAYKLEDPNDTRFQSTDKLRFEFGEKIRGGSDAEKAHE